MSSSNFQNSGNGLEALRKAWRINGINSSNGWLSGYVRVPNVFLRYMNELNLGGSQASLGFLQIYLISRDFANRKSYCHPSHAEISDNLCLNKKSVERNLRALEGKGMIEVERYMNDDGSFRNNRYTWKGFTDELRKLCIRDKLIIVQNGIPAESSTGD